MATLNDVEQRKVTALSPLLRAIERDGVYTIKVIDVRIARIGILQRSVVLISRPALALPSNQEIQAQLAHEFGHEYFSHDFDHASAIGDRRRLRELELLSDAIGIVLLWTLRMDPLRLMTGVEKVTLYNRKKFGAAIDETGYPTLADRRDFARAVLAWLRR